VEKVVVVVLTVWTSFPWPWCFPIKRCGLALGRGGILKQSHNGSSTNSS